MIFLSGKQEQAATIGKLLSPHGVAGLVKVLPYSDFPERCRELRRVTVELDGRQSRMTVEKAAVYGRFWLLKLQGVDTREQAARLSGGLLQIPLAERVPLPEGRYYFDQIIGLQVVTAGGKHLGEITDVISTGGHELYVIRQTAGGGDPSGELLLPAVHRFVKEIDLAGGQMVVELPEGLAER